MNTPNSNFNAKLALSEIIGEDLADDVKFFRTEKNNDKVFVKFKISKDDPYNEVDSGKLEKFKDWLSLSYIGETDSGFNKSYKKLMKTIPFDKSIKVVEVFKRVGSYNNKIYIDLCNDAREVVKIGDNSDGQAWTIINEDEITDPILFYRTQGMKELPKPKRGRKLKELLSSIINANDTDLTLIICWLLIALKSDLICPILCLNARKGQGKSTTTKIIKSIIDPDNALALLLSNTAKDFNVVAASRYVLPFDNIGKITEKLNTNLCCAVTGAVAADRKLFTDDEVSELNIKSRIIMNGIDCIPARSDLRDRCYFVSMQKLDAKRRKSDSELKQLFNNAESEILGALFTALHGGLLSNYEPEFEFDVRITGAKFACKCIKADKDNILQISENDFKRALAYMKFETDEQEIQENELTKVFSEIALYKYERERKNNPETTEITLWNEPTKGILKDLKEFAQDNSYNVKKLPENARQLGKKIGEKSPCRPILEENGFSFEQHRQSGTGDYGWIIKFKPKQRIDEQDSNDVNEIQSTSMQPDLREDANISQVVDSQENSRPEISDDKKKLL